MHGWDTKRISHSSGSTARLITQQHDRGKADQDPGLGVIHRRLLLLRTTNQRSKWNKTLDQGGSRTEGVLVQAQSVARYLDGQGGVRNRTAVAADSHGNHSRAVDRLVCAVR